MIDRWLQRCRAISCLSHRVMGINRRNLDYIYPNDDRKYFPLADDKLQTKQVMEMAGVPVPRTYHVYRHFFEMGRLKEDLWSCGEFVIKPAQGRAGSGIIVIGGHWQENWYGLDSRLYGVHELRKHISDIIFGVYSFDMMDKAIIEERIAQHPIMEQLSLLGLADIRVILYRDRPIQAMIRLPTRKSAGRANLHQGAVGLGIDLATGHTGRAVQYGRPCSNHPDSGAPLSGLQLPCWDEVLRISRRAAQALPLKYIGADVALSTTGPVLLEVNVRPGLEIQNANQAGLRADLQSQSDAAEAAR